jgi:hypothetical protein
VTINVESVGTVFGITREDLVQLRFVHLGQEALPSEADDLAALLASTYEAQRWALSLAITRLNFRLTSSAFAIAEYFKDIEAQMQAGRRLRYEEIAFLLDVFAVQLEGDRLPLVSLQQLGNVLQRAHVPSDGVTADTRLTAETLGVLTAKTSALAQATLDRLAGAVGALNVEDERLVSIECCYAEAPRVDVPSLLARATLAAELPLKHPPTRIAVRQGSYIEIIQASLATAFAFQILFYALNGVLIQLIEMKERIRVLRQQRAPRKFELLARTDQQTLPAALRQPVRKLLEFASSGGWMQKADLDGLDSSNLRHVEIDAVPPPESDGEVPSSPSEMI